MMKTLTLEASADGLTLHGLYCEPESAPKGIVQLVHGMCEHKERYIPFMEFLAAGGYACVIHDHRGHGESVMDQSTDLGYMYAGGWDALVEDIHTVNGWARRQWPDLKLCMLGHSMGSLAARCYTRRHGSCLDRLVVCGSPGHNPAAGLGILLAKADALLNGDHHRPALIQNIAFSAFNRPFSSEGYPSAWVCSDKDVLEAYHSDRLCMFTFTANGFDALFHGMKECYSPKGWKPVSNGMPVFFISGADDPCMVNRKTWLQGADMMRRMGYGVESRLYEGMRHEILNETHKALVWNDVLEFLERQ